jgi:hypothetical protein
MSANAAARSRKYELRLDALHPSTRAPEPGEPAVTAIVMPATHEERTPSRSAAKHARLGKPELRRREASSSRGLILVDEAPPTTACRDAANNSARRRLAPPRPAPAGVRGRPARAGERRARRECTRRTVHGASTLRGRPSSRLTGAGHQPVSVVDETIQVCGDHCRVADPEDQLATLRISFSLSRTRVQCASAIRADARTEATPTRAPARVRRPR